ncbi:MAG TPA: 3-deoxy-manno-octulosonate cytidylyltransferase [Gemmatimonadaceae bacterium]|nr:3-deoxy-manno-octulosonate cytidylyltransferase [Gemmatimonadaceae bacterium]
MTTLAVIPARLGATRLPRKPLRLLGGAPLIVRVWERLTALALVDRVVVATDSDEVARTARDAGAECVLTDPRHPSGTDRVAEITRKPEFAGYEVIVNVQGDEPFLPADATRGALELVASGAFPLGTAAVPAPAAVLDTPDVVKVVRADDGRALYFSRAGIPFLRDDADRSERDATILQHLGIYAYTRDALARWVALPPHPLERVERLEQLRPLAAGMAIGVAVLDDEAPRGIDTEEDLRLANDRWTTLMSGRA